MSVVAEAVVTKEIVDFVGGEILEGVRTVWYVTLMLIEGKRGRVGGKRRIASLLIQIDLDVGAGEGTGGGWTTAPGTSRSSLTSSLYS